MIVSFQIVVDDRYEDEIEEMINKVMGDPYYDKKDKVQHAECLTSLQINLRDLHEKLPPSNNTIKVFKNLFNEVLDFSSEKVGILNPDSLSADFIQRFLSFQKRNSKQMDDEIVEVDIKTNSIILYTKDDTIDEYYTIHSIISNNLVYKYHNGCPYPLVFLNLDDVKWYLKYTGGMDAFYINYNKKGIEGEFVYFRKLTDILSGIDIKEG